MFAVNDGEVATPLAPVTTDAVADMPKSALAPEAGAVNVTVTPDTGVPLESFTVATKVFGKAAPIVALCPVPLVETTPNEVPRITVALLPSAANARSVLPSRLKSPAAMPSELAAG